MTSVVVTGVSGSGKSAVGRSLASRLNWRYVDADQTPDAIVKEITAWPKGERSYPA